MKEITDLEYSRINNEIYDAEGSRWWDTDFSLNLIKAVYNPFRVSYIKNAIEDQFGDGRIDLSILEVGSGGGILAEEIAKLGYTVTGIDPSKGSVEAAKKHAAENKLSIQYQQAFGEDMPFNDSSFDIVLCCDVLEHVRDVSVVISEIARVIKENGIFIYDTFNRTILSKISLIKIQQDWKRWAILPSGLHAWELFIKPSELKELLVKNNFTWISPVGIKADKSYPAMLRLLRQRAKGNLTYEEFGGKFKMVATKSLKSMYMGKAVKKKKIS